MGMRYADSVRDILHTSRGSAPDTEGTDGPSKPSTSARPPSSSSARPPSASSGYRVPSAASASRHDDRERDRAVPSRQENRDRDRERERERTVPSRNGKMPERVEPPIHQVEALRIHNEQIDPAVTESTTTAAARQLDGVPLEIQEAWVCEDLIFVLQVSIVFVCFALCVVHGLTGGSQGGEGSLIRYDESYDPLDEDQRLQGARWRVDPSLGE